MAGRKGFESSAAMDDAFLAVHVAFATSNYSAGIAGFQHAKTLALASLHKALWRQRAAQRGARLGRVWRDFARGFRGLEWRRRKVAPGVWTVELLDASEAWIHAATVEAPPLRRMEDRVLVRVIGAPHPVTVHVLRAPDRCVGRRRDRNML